MADLTPLEERIAHLERMAEDLSAIVARQEREIERLGNRLRLLLEAEAERLAQGPMPPPEKPPHW
jgi:SlyX protein